MSPRCDNVANAENMKTNKNIRPMPESKAQV